jgi:hypothetical protein
MPKDDKPMIPVYVGTSNPELLGNSKIWEKIDPSVIKANLDKLLRGLGGAIPEADSHQTGYSLKEFEVSLKIGAKGEVGFLGTGVEGSGEASLKLKFAK